MPNLSHNVWLRIDPSKNYPSWKKFLKERISRNVYSQIVRYAVRFSTGSDRKRLLGTDLWLQALGYPMFDEWKSDFDIFGIDLSGVVCTRAKGMTSLKGIAQASILELPFCLGAFDVVIDISTLDHVRPSDVAGVVTEYVRVLKTGGILLLCVDSKLGLPWEIYRSTLTYPTWSWTPKQMRMIVAARNLEVLKVFYANTLLEVLSERISRLVHSRLSPAFSGLAQYHVIIARKI